MGFIIAFFGIIIGVLSGAITYLASRIFGSLTANALTAFIIMVHGTIVWFGMSLV
jgi:hypothetical protein